MLLISLVIRFMCESRQDSEGTEADALVAYVLNGTLKNLNAFNVRSFKIDVYAGMIKFCNRFSKISYEDAPKN